MGKPGTRVVLVPRWATVSLLVLVSAAMALLILELSGRAYLHERTSIVETIGRIKRSLDLPIYEPKREEDVFRNVTDHNGGPLPAEAVKRIFERIIDEMRTVQRIRIIEEQQAQKTNQGSGESC